MFFEPKNGHGLPHNPFNALVVPRPIGWISSRDSDGSIISPLFVFQRCCIYAATGDVFVNRKQSGSA